MQSQAILGDNVLDRKEKKTTYGWQDGRRLHLWVSVKLFRCRIEAILKGGDGEEDMF